MNIILNALSPTVPYITLRKQIYKSIISTQKDPSSFAHSKSNTIQSALHFHITNAYFMPWEGGYGECLWSFCPLHIFTTVRLFHVALARVSVSLRTHLMRQELWLQSFYCAVQQFLSGHTAMVLNLQPALRLITCAVGDKLT